MMPSGTITFHLVAPDPEFLYKLTMPFAYPVPPSVPDEEQVAAGVPGTGPYMLEAPMTDEGLTLVRNPHFQRLVAGGAARWVRGPDRVDLRGGTGGAGRGRRRWRSRPRVRSCGCSGRLEDLFVRFPAQVHTSPMARTFFAVLDTRVPPFDDVDVRRAMNLAMDRDRVVQIFGGEAAARTNVPATPAELPRVRALLPVHDEPRPRGGGVVDRPGHGGGSEARPSFRHGRDAGRGRVPPLLLAF